jgi:hypothetical protein
MMAPSPMLLFDLLKSLSLFVSKIGRDLVVRFHHDSMNALASVAPYLSKLHSRLIDNRRDLGDLFWC